MTYEEREKLEDQIDEKANELKELVSQLEDQRVDFEEDEECGDVYVWYNDVVFETSELKIYQGSNWYYDDELYVSSIFVKDDQLYFAADYCCYTSDGSWSDGKHLDYITMELLKRRSSYCGNEAYLLETLKFCTSILKGCYEGLAVGFRDEQD